MKQFLVFPLMIVATTVALAGDPPEMRCMASVGLFCISPPIGETKLTLSNVGIGAAASVSAKSWSAILGLYTDAPRPLKVSKLDLACIGDKCVHYWRRCYAAAQVGTPVQCDFIFESLSSVSLTADNELAETEALTSLGVIVDGPDRVAIPLSMMTLESKLAEPPYEEN